MVHSICTYLESQATPLLKQLLRQYETMSDQDYYAFLASMIRTILFLRGAHDESYG